MIKFEVDTLFEMITDDFWVSVVLACCVPDFSFELGVNCKPVIIVYNTY